MRPVREITAEEENFRIEPLRPGAQIGVIRRDPVQPESVGTIIMCPFRIVGYQRDCDGSLLAQLEGIDAKGEPIGWTEDSVGLYPNSSFVISPEELVALIS